VTAVEVVRNERQDELCEYCGCQSIPAINELTGEHDSIVDLIGEIRAGLALGVPTPG